MVYIFKDLAEDDEDSNDEQNWRNDYPDEEDNDADGDYNSQSEDDYENGFYQNCFGKPKSSKYNDDDYDDEDYDQAGLFKFYHIWHHNIIDYKIELFYLFTI